MLGNDWTKDETICFVEAGKIKTISPHELAQQVEGLGLTTTMTAGIVSNTWRLENDRIQEGFDHIDGNTYFVANAEVLSKLEDLLAEEAI